MKKVTKKQAEKIIAKNAYAGLAFKAEFITKSGELRAISGSINESIAMPYNLAEKGLISVIEDGNFKMVNLKTLKSFQINGIEYKIN